MRNKAMQLRHKQMLFIYTFMNNGLSWRWMVSDLLFLLARIQFRQAQPVAVWPGKTLEQLEGIGCAISEHNSYPTVMYQKGSGRASSPKNWRDDGALSRRARIARIQHAHRARSGTP